MNVGIGEGLFLLLEDLLFSWTACKVNRNWRREGLFGMRLLADGQRIVEEINDGRWVKDG